jgi:hypothetical protein
MKNSYDYLIQLKPFHQRKIKIIALKKFCLIKQFLGILFINSFLINTLYFEIFF